VSAEVLREVEILLKAGKAVEDDGGGVRACSGSEIEDAEKIAAVAGQNHLLGGGGRVGWGLREERRGEQQGRSEGVPEFHGGEYRADEEK
jgi:hypothetical protein